MIRIGSAKEFEDLLHELTGFEAPLSELVASSVEDLIERMGAVEADFRAVSKSFYGRINEKLDANRVILQSLYAECAKHEYTFNYPQKKSINRAINESDPSALRKILESVGLPNGLVSILAKNCAPVDWKTTRELLYAETVKPSKLRKSLQRTVEGDVINSSAGPLVWAIWPTESLYRAFGGGGAGSTAREYMRYLECEIPTLFKRDRTLSIRFVQTDLPRYDVREEIFSWISSEYTTLANHGFIALVVDAEDPGRAWKLVNDATLFAERFKEVELKQMFFRHKEVKEATVQHIPGLDPQRARFDVLNEGFTYRDVFVLTDTPGKIKRLVLVMQKNMRDETKIPCPSCRGLNIEGNSYPTFGVRSWECRNPLCPSRSIYNRGYRFSFRSTVQQAAIEDPRNTISFENVNRWRKDVLVFEDDEEIARTLIQHYSIADDGVAVIGLPQFEISDCYARTVTSAPASTSSDVPEFWASSFFHRFIVPTDSIEVRSRKKYSIEGPYQILEGDSTEVLKGISSDTFDRAITSPPYYNAREYAQWPNLYCYLHDMRMNAIEVFRTLKPGAIYAYNIFDYFDNERIVTFSAMGQKRIPLGALMAHIFEGIGFDLAGVIPWDKGDIHGKRGFNGGNYSPYYQSPFNCWEHVLILQKPPQDSESCSLGIQDSTLSSTARISPVFKMVRGQNTYGHTAPYPEALPALLLEGLSSEAVVLDPYAGSGTTARAALEKGMRAVLIERDSEYVELARRMTEERLTASVSTLF